MTQYSLFGAAAAQPSVDDLDGLLLAGGQWVRSGAGARLSVVVADRWRADALHDAFAERGVATTPDDAVVEANSGFGVRTAFGPELIARAARWTRGSRQGLPPDFQLAAGSLRLWALAAGRPDDVGYLLTTAGVDDATHRTAGAQLARLGVAAVSVSRRGSRDHRGWRVTSGRRLRRLIELLGPAPSGGAASWPAALPGRPQSDPSGGGSLADH
ncbi:hypothetical protein [uncultured Jatrophihabitans sp.]|uniref:hypothetical protein n=1 Tax=uncultured Jatrophihabitans sp. TaxID=1610747 RepID=UPI0035CB7F9A